MLSFLDRSVQLCDGIRRREFLKIGGLSLLGVAGSTLLSNSSIAKPAAKAKRCILLFLLGGPPQHSTWDPKPNASDDIRGAFGPVQTKIPGIQISEVLEKTSKHIDKLAILRAVSTGDHAHSSSGYAMLTGRPHLPLNVENANPGAPNDWPTIGAVVQQLHTGPRTLPPSIRLPHHIFNTDNSVWPGQNSGWLGAKADPWLFRCQPASESYQVPEFQLPVEVPFDRFEGRRSLLSQLDSHLRAIDQTGQFDSFTQQQQQAYNVLSSPESRGACDLSLESDATRDLYGRNQFGQSVLLARRLIESGVSLVQVNWFRGADEPSDAPCWDSHANETNRLKTVLGPPLDTAMSALLGDLAERGLLEETLVICMGEFGRTPKFNPRGGRDHWGHVFSLAMAGAGIRGGIVHGESDNQGGYPISGLVGPQDVAATIFHAMGLPPETTIRDQLGRDFPISTGRVIKEIVV